LGLPELITYSSEDYERKAFELATHPEILHKLREKPSQTANGHELFDGRRFAFKMESAFEKMIQECD
jgi:predicted O-linked N-acetylglucosamine transferase (SPINDLY family)